jgi:hypothetical protein
MRDTTDQKLFGGETIHVGDCYIWAEIYYLDSPTDYREYISNHVAQPTTTTGGGFITLDNAGGFPWRAVAKALLVLLPMLFTLAWK